ncbi:MAG TPA: acetate--CoA ligase family protein [Anaerolineae bacterium]|nr:acetate--CoA ligase family protein [Anaerolineae bacterium]
MLNTLFAPRGVAVIGASRDATKLSYGVARNLIASGYAGAIHFVNPRANRIMGLPCYPSISSVPDPVDLAVIVIPAAQVPQSLEDCGRRGVRAAIIISGGFGETGAPGKRLERQIAEIARRWGLRLVGPNCIGVIDMHLPLNTTFIKSVPQAGDIAFVSQSGAICQAVIDWGAGMGFGFSRVASLGNQADVSESEVIAALADDPHTQVVTLYLEGVRDGQQFLHVVGAAARRKAVVALKVGRTTAGQRAVSSHTGALAGQETAYNAAFRRCGVLRASSTEELFDWARALAWCPPLRGDRVAVLTNAGGPGIIAADALESSSLRLATLSEETRATLRTFTLAHASLANPIDLLASAGPADYAAALRGLLADPDIDAVLVISVPPPIEDSTPVAEAIAQVGQGTDKPIVVAVMGEATVGAALHVLRAAHLPDYHFPERAASALAALHRHTQWQAQPPFTPAAFSDVKRAAAAQLLASAGERLISGPPATAILSEYGIYGPGEVLVTCADEAVDWADKFGYPVVLKVASPDIAHKSDIGGVALDLADAVSVRQAFQRVVEAARRARPDARIPGATMQQMIRHGQEVIIGVVRDAQFGPLAMFGAGGVEVEGMRDVAFGLAPLSRPEAEAMLDATFAGRRLRGYRNAPPADREAVVDALLRLAQFAADFPQVAEVEVNPLRVQRQGQGAVGVDVRIRLAGRTTETLAVS